jgi:mono/diheme cytochrome c family protein
VFFFLEVIMTWRGMMQWALALVLVAAVAVLWRAPAAGHAKGENKVVQCGGCHTPRNSRGELDITRHLQGAPIWFKPTKIKFEHWEDTAPDLTPSGLTSKWGEEKLVKFLSTGAQADAPMPAFKLTEGDARAVVAYLRSLPGKR